MSTAQKPPPSPMQSHGQGAKPAGGTAPAIRPERASGRPMASDSSSKVIRLPPKPVSESGGQKPQKPRLPMKKRVVVVLIVAVIVAVLVGTGVGFWKGSVSYGLFSGVAAGIVAGLLGLAFAGI